MGNPNFYFINFFKWFQVISYFFSNSNLFLYFIILTYVIILITFFTYVNLLKYYFQKRSINKRKYQLKYLRTIMNGLQSFLFIPFINSNLNIIFCANNIKLYDFKCFDFIYLLLFLFVKKKKENHQYQNI